MTTETPGRLRWVVCRSNKHFDAIAQNPEDGGYDSFAVRHSDGTLFLLQQEWTIQESSALFETPKRTEWRNVPVEESL